MARQRLAMSSVRKSMGALAALLLSTAASGDTFTWIDPLGGLFHDPGNWSPVGVPFGSDAAIFDLNNTYTVDFAANQSIDELLIKSGQITFALDGNMLSALDGGFTTPGIRVGELSGDDAWLTINGGALTGVNGAIGDDDADAVGRIDVSGLGASLLLEDELSVGGEGVGTLLVEAGGLVQSQFGVVAREAGSHGSAIVTGAGSTWETRDLYLGRIGEGTLEILDGGLVTTTREVHIGAQPGADGQVLVSGKGSRLEHDPEPANAEFVVGKPGGHGSLGVRDGGVVEAPEILIDNGELFGDGLIVGNVTNLGTVTPGVGAVGLGAGVDEIGTLSIMGGYTQDELGNLAIDLASLSAFDTLEPEHAELAGMLSVSLLDDFGPELGDAFDIVTTSQDINGEFDFLDLPSLPGNLFFDVVYLPDMVRLQVVPAPGALVALPLLAALMRHRRRG